MIERLKMGLSPKQFEFVKRSTAKINIAHGSVRSGKTHSSLIRFGEAALKCPDDKIIMIGKSAGSIFDNAVKPLALDDSAPFRGMCSWSPGKGVLNFCGKDIRVIGANDQSAVGRIQGSTISLAYVDEMTLLPQNFMDMLYSRLSQPWSMLIGTTNPDTPFHPLKKMVDESDGKEVYSLHFILEDNPALEDSYKKMLDRLYSGLWRRRFVLGEWCLAEGAIYDFFDRKFHVVDRPPTYAQYYIAGVDYGTSNPFAMVLLGINEEVSPSAWVEKEFYYDPKVMGRQKTDAEFAEDLELATRGYPVRVMYLDPSAESLQVELKKRKKVVKEAVNDVRPGIGTVANFMCQGDLVICKSAENLIKEIEGYTWDPKKVMLGEDAPLKVRDHACDALRYAIHTHFGNRLKIQKAPQRDPFRNPARPTDWGYEQFGGGYGGMYGGR